VRIVAATSASLEAAVEKGSFRRDLYYRLRVLTLRLPPLRERSGDIPVLAKRLLETVCRRLEAPQHRLSTEALHALAAAKWPGNVRQLIHELERAVVASEGVEIEVGHLSPEVQGRVSAGLRTSRPTVSGGSETPAPSPTPEDAAVDVLLRKLAGLSEPARPPVRRSSASIPGYHLIERIAEGGMGEVWRAEQREPVRREVAVKLIRAGMEVPSVIARFEAERQALALMDHPSIPKVFAGGSTEQGSPFLVMEYVRGVPLDQHCDRARSSLRERLEIFRQLCAGVQHAHQRGILHRDLKPANVLVTRTDGIAQAKIVDFGIAKALVQPLTEKTVQTELGQVVGTVEYMSPEQANLTQQDIDTRSDVYSLGVMLYQLLSGVLPRSGTGRSQDVEPPRPSDRWVTGTEEGRALARARRSEPRLLRRQIAGDLDAIVMKALERERGRRYDSVAELSADLGRYLERQPVTARRSGPGSFVWRYLRLHRIGVAPVAGAVLLALHMGFSAAVLLQVRQASFLRAPSVAGAGRRVPVAAGQQGEPVRISDGNPQRNAGHRHLLLAR